MNTQILTDLCATPTAPFAEHYITAFVERFVKDRPALKLYRDRVGNLLIKLAGKQKSPRWVFTAHMDHPGLVAERMDEEGMVNAHFYGGVKITYVKNAKVRFFYDNADGRRVEVAGRIVEVRGDEKDRPDMPRWVRVQVKKPVPAGAPGMFDLTPGRLTAQRFSSRVCDDLAGAAAALTMLDELMAAPPQATVCVLLTRAEEEGFIGAIAAASRPELLRRTDRIIAIETSAAQPFAPLGCGAIIRIGDKTSIFNSGLSYFMAEQAGELSKQEPSFRYLRALMPGGTCETTVYDAYGFTAGSICIALANYHNMDQQKRRLAPERIDRSDWENMVRLFIHLARTGHQYQPGHKLLKSRLQKRFRSFRRQLLNPV